MSRQPRRQLDRAAYRAYVRANHPDVGGDPDEFAAGLAEFDREQPEPADAPIVVVHRPAGLLGLPSRARHWWERRHAPPRVR